MTANARLATSSLLAAVLFLCSAGVVVLQPAGMGADTPRGWLLALAVPLSASAALPLLSSLFPSLVPDGRFRFPLNLTWPAVHGALLVAFAALYGTTGVGVVAVPEPLQGAVSWSQPGRWGVSVVVQIVVLTAALLAGGRRRR